MKNIKTTYIIATKEEQQEYLAYKTPADVLSNLSNGVELLDSLLSENKAKNHILICGGMAAFDRGILDFLNKWSEDDEKLFLLSEVTAEFRRYTKEKVIFPHICTPHLLAKEMIIIGMDIPITEEMTKLTEEVPYLNDAKENLSFRHTTLGTGYAIAWAYYAYLYINKLIDYLIPSKVVLWNAFYAFHQIFNGICLERKIPVSYIEFGCLPGTICIEDIGQQGESIVAREPDDFLAKKISCIDYLKSITKICNWRCTGLNRNIQPDVMVNEKLFNHYKTNRKTISYFGQNDYESGLCPYNEKAREYHSPIFRSTFEALEYLSVIAIKNDWNLIYKPHPIMLSLQRDIEVANSKDIADIIEEVNINSVIDFSDLVVTILSQSAYIALIRNRPVLMLGYTQLKNKGCTYEAFSPDEIEAVILRALSKGYTRLQKHYFRKHVAQLMKYYLFEEVCLKY